MEQLDQLNYLSIIFLEKLGNKAPSQTQIDYMESILSNNAINIKFNYKINPATHFILARY